MLSKMELATCKIVCVFLGNGCGRHSVMHAETYKNGRDEQIISCPGIKNINLMYFWQDYK